MNLILVGIGALLLANLIFVILVYARQGKEEAKDHSELLQKQLTSGRQEAAASSRELRQELLNTMHQLGESQTGNWGTFQKSMQGQLHKLQEGNEKKLDQMREVVDEKLQKTLEKRLGESFKMVGENLMRVQEGLGEMRVLAKGVGDLQKVLTNVKSRGTWGEVQLEALLGDILTEHQFQKNVRPRPDSDAIVEFAVKLPGTESEVWLPIDSKFPTEDYLRLVEASEKGKPDEVVNAQKALIRSVKESAKEISKKYVHPPYTTDFAILFLPTEGLYAEVLREPGIVESLQRDHRIVVAGPTTLAALLNSLRVGFHTLAIEQRTVEVWKVLGGVKKEFEKFETHLGKLHRHLSNATSMVEQTKDRARLMQKTLKDTEALPAEEAEAILDLPESQSARPDESAFLEHPNDHL